VALQLVIVECNWIGGGYTFIARLPSTSTQGVMSSSRKSFGMEKWGAQARSLLRRGASKKVQVCMNDCGKAFHITVAHVRRAGAHPLQFQWLFAEPCTAWTYKTTIEVFTFHCALQDPAESSELVVTTPRDTAEDVAQLDKSMRAKGKTIGGSLAAALLQNLYSEHVLRAPPGSPSAWSATSQRHTACTLLQLVALAARRYVGSLEHLT
jgi:hypothetical protein